MHVEADRIREVGVQRHPWRKRDGIVGVEAHHQGGGSGRDTRCEQDTFGRHPRLRQDLRVHDDDVGHRHECREATQHLLLDGGLVLGEFEVTSDQWCSFTAVVNDFSTTDVVPILETS